MIKESLRNTVRTTEPVRTLESENEQKENEQRENGQGENKQEKRDDIPKFLNLDWRQISKDYVSFYEIIK